MVYSGTHDNDTTQGWYQSASKEAQHNFRTHLSVDGTEAPYDLIRCAYRSDCKLAIIPLQDLMCLGSEARFNAPGTEQGNWQWRYQPEQLEALRGATTDYLHQLAKETGRLDQ